MQKNGFDGIFKMKCWIAPSLSVLVAHCGTTHLKRLLLAIAFLGVVGCGGGGSPTNDSASSVSSSGGSGTSSSSSGGASTSSSSSSSGAAQGSTLVPLRYAAPPPGINAYGPVTQCAASGFAGNAIVGVCQYGLLPGPAPYHQWRVANYAVGWDFNGVPAITGVSAIEPSFNPTHSVVVINGQPYYYVAANA